MTQDCAVTVVAVDDTEDLVKPASSKPLRCWLGMHHMIWFSTSDGGRWKHCAHCGTDWSGSGAPSWNYQSGPTGRMGF